MREPDTPTPITGLMMRTCNLVIASALSVACAGHLETQAIEPSALQPGKGDSGVNGVVFYQPQYVKITYSLTKFIDSSGVVSDTCTQLVQKEELQIQPDFSKPFVIRQTGSFLSATKLAVTLSEGMLSSVNVEATPQTAELLNALAPLLPLRGTNLGQANSLLPKPQACNAAPIISRAVLFRLGDTAGEH